MSSVSVIQSYHCFIELELGISFAYNHCEFGAWDLPEHLNFRIPCFAE